MDKYVTCPKCGAVEWQAIEQFTSLTPCQLPIEDGEVQVEFGMNAEFVRDAATSVTTAYLCSNQDCGYTLKPEELNQAAGGGNGG